MTINVKTFIDISYELNALLLFSNYFPLAFYVSINEQESEIC